MKITDIPIKKLRERFMEIHLMNGSMWQHKHVNKKFLKTLKKKFGRKTFTNKEAYVVYVIKHLHWYDHVYNKLRKRGIKAWQVTAINDIITNNPYVTMNVRNTLCAAVCYKEYGLLRMGLGKYRFVK